MPDVSVRCFNAKWQEAMVTNHNKGTRRKTYSKSRVGKHWNMLPRQVVESPFLENFHSPAGQGPEQNALSSPLASLRIWSLYRWPPEFLSELHFFMMPWFFSETYGHLIPVAVVSPIHISSFQGHILIFRGQAAWENSFFIIVYFWNFIWLMYAHYRVTVQALKQISAILSMWAN